MNSFSNKCFKATLIKFPIKAFHLIIGSVFFCFLLFPIGTNKANIYKNGTEVKTVVIDAGHGGHDTGCLGHSRVNEKVVALNIALKLGAYIEDNFKDVKVVYTRKTDIFVELEERAAIANRNNADLFISIHCNAASAAAYGTETYVMGLHKTEGNLNVAKRENSVIALEDNHENRYEGLDLNSDEAYIIMSLTQNAFLGQSINFADKVQDQFRERVGRHDRGVKAAGFWVLWRTAMPSVLIETGFLTNAAEEKFLNSSQGQDYIASAIYRAFKDYKGEIEKSNSSLEVLNSNKAPKVEVIQKEENAAMVEVNKLPAVNSDDTSYRVQLFVSSKGIENFSKKFKKVDHLIVENLPNGLYRYSSGPFKSETDAVNALRDLKQNGFTDSFISLYKGNERVQILKSK